MSFHLSKQRTMITTTKFVTRSATLYYIKEDLAFNTLPLANDASGSLMIEDVIITLNSEGELVQVWGYCPYHSWITRSLEIPTYKKSGLKETEEIPVGVSYRINENDLSIFFDPSKNLICMGDPSNEMDFFHFAPGAIMGLRNMEFLSLWLFFTMVQEHPRP